MADIISQAKEDLLAQTAARKAAQLQINYLERDRSKMLYQTLRSAGHFIGSGVVEAGCKVVVGQRLKQSGMLVRAKEQSTCWPSVAPC
ncbi:MAG TPA: hypothetical protein VEC99_02580 [Clostridia bacterium]|nr:hypothetical protein [Clostridia bacterium]